jgi:hypothetical protein
MNHVADKDALTIVVVVVAARSAKAVLLLLLLLLLPRSCCCFHTVVDDNDCDYDDTVLRLQRVSAYCPFYLCGVWCVLFTCAVGWRNTEKMTPHKVLFAAGIHWSF